MLLTYLVRPPTAPPDRWRRSEFVASHWSLMEKFVRNYPRPSEDRVAVLSDFFANFDAASMADSCCALNFLTSCFLDYHLRQGYGFLFWTGRNSITQHVAAVSVLSVPARDHLEDCLRGFTPALLQYPAANEGIVARDKIARTLQAHLQSSEHSQQVAAQVAAHSAWALDFLVTSAREFFFQHVHLFHDLRLGPLPFAWHELAGGGRGGGQGAGDAGLRCGRDRSEEVFRAMVALCVEQLVRCCNMTQCLAEISHARALRPADMRLTFDVPAHEVAAARRVFESPLRPDPTPLRPSASTLETPVGEHRVFRALVSGWRARGARGGGGGRGERARGARAIRGNENCV